MKLSLKLSFFACLVLLASCGEVREEITFNKDGSGTYEVSANIIPMMEKMMQSTAKLTIPDGETMDSAALAAKVQEMVWKDFPDKIDSVISLDSKLTPEMKNDPQTMALLDKTTAYMRGSREEGFIKTGIRFGFSSNDEFLSFMNMIEENGQKNNQENPLGKTKTEVTITPKSFTRTVEHVNKPEEDPSGGMAMLMLQDMSMLTVLNFPRKIDKVEVQHYEIIEKSENSVTLKFDMVKAMKSDSKSEIRVKLK
ncbi:hypothetical protein LVD17_23935 [Fulvivirga ulvae]|uniref:hypothetical protein n=1 Tax=Fulvivirga ulvae TaxID=2904245 RepID=UPI001F16EB03|nr:hypothetical protein [Fulvivirga ulvae]UII31347.1 hypothetical protein LVD17_23935 [Fulvivirga ulvae]